MVVKHQSPIVITALGSPARVVEAAHEYDGLVLVCSGAGRHTGGINSFAFVTEVRKFFDDYIALAGGISNGNAVLASIAAGADFAYMGTSFIATEESLAEPEYMQMVIDYSAEDLLVNKASQVPMPVC